MLVVVSLLEAAALTTAVLSAYCRLQNHPSVEYGGCRLYFSM